MDGRSLCNQPTRSDIIRVYGFVLLQIRLDMAEYIAKKHYVSTAFAILQTYIRDVIKAIAKMDTSKRHCSHIAYRKGIVRISQRHCSHIRSLERERACVREREH